MTPALILILVVVMRTLLIRPVEWGAIGSGISSAGVVSFWSQGGALSCKGVLHAGFEACTVDEAQIRGTSPT